MSGRGRKGRGDRRKRGQKRASRFKRGAEQSKNDWKQYETPRRSKHAPLDMKSLIKNAKPVDQPQTSLKSISRAKAVRPPEAQLTRRVPSVLPRHIEGLNPGLLWWRNLVTRWVPWRDNPRGWWHATRGSRGFMAVVVLVMCLGGLLLVVGKAPVLLGAMVLAAGPVAALLASWQVVRQQWRLLQIGQPRRARVRRIEVSRDGEGTGPLVVTYGFRDLTGRRRRITTRISRAELGGELKAGSPFDALVHPDIADPLVPYLVGADFAEPVEALTVADEAEEEEPALLVAIEAEDTRPERIEPGEVGLFEPVPFVARLFEQAPGGGLVRRLRQWLGRGAIAVLSADDEALHWQFEDQRVSLPWAVPWTVHASVRLLSASKAELNLTIRRHSTVAAEAIRFKVELDQRRLARTIPIKWETCPYLPAADLARLWPMLRAHAATHGRPALDWL